MPSGFRSNPKVIHAEHLVRTYAGKTALVVFLSSLGFIFLYPVIYMVSTSLMAPEDLVSPYVFFIPHHLFLDNYRYAYLGLGFLDAIKYSAILAVSASILQVGSTAIVGYGFARYRSKLTNVLFGLVIFTLIVPPQTIIVPLYFQFSQYGWIGTFRSMLVPAALGHGIRGALFVIVFRQFFATLPWELEDAARIDGAGDLRIFTRVMLPLAKSAIVIVLLFSFVWHWNDHYMSSVFLDAQHAPISTRLSVFWAALYSPPPEQNLLAQEMRIYNVVNPWRANSEGIAMAASLMVIAVPLIVFVVMQRYFTESVDRTGLVE